MRTLVLEEKLRSGQTVKHKAAIPTSWNECSLRQALALYTIIMSGEPNVNVKRIRILCFLGQISAADLENMKADQVHVHGPVDGEDAYLEELEALCQQVADPFFDITEKADARHYSIALNLTKCPYPFVTYEKKHGQRGDNRLYAAADGFGNMTIYELGTVFTMVENYLRSADADLLHRLLATVWREPKDPTPENRKSGYQGDQRRPLQYEESMVPRRAKHFAILPPQVKQLMLFWLISCRAAIIREYPVIFDSQKTPDPESKDYGWGGLILQLAQGPAHVDDIARSRWGNVFLYLAMKEDERKLLELQNARK